MPGGVFVLKGQTTLVAMKPAGFATEDDFQRLLADFPALLDGMRGDGEVPRRWLLLGREKGIPSQEGGSDRWAVDHLFLDQDGVPTFVEVKRQTDTRLRRDVVGQMLDYAANAVLYWSGDRMQDQFEADCLARGADATMAIGEALGDDIDVDSLWETAKTNLQAGKVRLLFVADLIPPEVKRIVEFLNKQMDPAEVLAIELRQYEGEGLRTIVPAVYGQTEEARQRKALTGPARQWDEAALFADMQQRVGADLLPAAHRITDWIKSNSDEVVFGRGSRTGSIGAAFRRLDARLLAFQLWSRGIVTLNFGYMLKPPFDDTPTRQGWIEQVSAVPGIGLPTDVENKYPGIPLSAFVQHLDAFLAAMDWLARRLRSQGTSPLA